MKARISTDNEDMMQEIERRIVMGESVAAICQDAHMPGESAFYAHLASDDAFRSRIARAKELQQDAEVDRMIALADSATPENWQVVRLQIWARQWRAAKLAPKRYGDQAAGTTVNVGVAVNVLTDERRMELIRKKRLANAD